MDSHSAPRQRFPPPDAVRGAFRELHAKRLHGFAVLLTLGAREHAASLAAQALADAVEHHLDELRHPERAAAWLRRHVVRHAGRIAAPRDATASRKAMLGLGADEPTVEALAALNGTERAALIASSVERLDQRDVATVVGRDGAGLDRLLRRARARYVKTYAAAAREEPAPGPIVTYIRDAARTAMT